MNLVEAVKSCLVQYATFRGRARRSEYWYFTLFSVLVNIPASAVDYATETAVSGFVVNVALFLPSLAVGARRLHDTGRSGWWQLLLLVPIVGLIVLIVWWATDTHGPNEYGPNPKELQAFRGDELRH